MHNQLKTSHENIHLNRSLNFRIFLVQIYFIFTVCSVKRRNSGINKFDVLENKYYKEINKTINV